MATYEQWNEALLEYVLSGAPRGARVYLSVDDDVIDFVAFNLSANSGDFYEAVRTRCVRNNSVDLSRIGSHTISQSDYQGKPQYIAFLSAMVLAAHHMGESEDQAVASINYFHYFNEILCLPLDEGRPPGMAHGPESLLWNHWNVWLTYHGYHATVQKIGDHYYTFALSQALLRQSDKNSLWRFFSANQHKYPDSLGKDDLVHRLINDMNYWLTNHLKELLTRDGKVGSQRYEDLADSLFENFEGWIEGGKQVERVKAFRTTQPGSIVSGLYRAENFISQEPNYYLLPRQPRHVQVSDMLIMRGSQNQQLRKERPGWYEPLSQSLTLQELESGLELDVSGNALIHKLLLPKRDYWILPPDPDDIESGIFASWDERPEIGIPFVFLTKDILMADIDQLRKDKLLTWSAHPKVLGDWVEYSDMVVISDVWGVSQISNRTLLSQLRPRSSISISLSGGLRDPISNAWLVDHGPEIIVHAFDDELQVLISRTGEENILERLETRSGETVHYAWSQVGNYQLRVESADDVRQRQVTILGWNSIIAAKPGNYQPIRIGSTTVYGAYIEETGETA